MEDQHAFYIISGVIVFASIWLLFLRRSCSSAQQSMSLPERMDRCTMRKSDRKISKNLHISEIGVNFNKWRRPVCTFAEDDIFTLLEELRSIGIDQDDWDRATRIVDSVLDMLLCEIKKVIPRHLIIDKYVRQGSAREGLKVNKADEFDVLLLFHINGLDLEIEHLTDGDNYILPEFGRLVIVDEVSEEFLHLKYPWLYRDCILFDKSVGKFCLNSRKLHEKVFISRIQTAAHELQIKVNNEKAEDKKFHFTIENFKINPPAVNIQIKLYQDDKKFPIDRHLVAFRDRTYGTMVSESLQIPFRTRTLIDVDIVPGIQFTTEKVPDPTDWDRTMDCPRYAVFRWVDENQAAAAHYNCPPEIRWRICTSGYEKHVMDVARVSIEQGYIVTALRIMKWKFQSLKGQLVPPQLVTVLSSYHLKQVAFYCILYLTVINKIKLSGAKQALAYYLDFLRVVLEEKRLPHFFHNNENIVCMFPEYKLNNNTLRYDLFMDRPDESLNQAKLSLYRLELKKKLCGNVFTFPELANIFRSYIRDGKYYKVPSKAAMYNWT